MKKTLRFGMVAVLTLSMTVVSLSLVPPQAEAAVSSWQKGGSIQSRYAEDFASDTFKQSVNNLKNNGGNYVTLIIPYYQSNTGSTDIAPGWNTPSDATLMAGINYAHSQGMHVMLKPHLETFNNDWRAYINPGDRDTWFKNYGTMIDHLADIGKQTGVEQICIGTELISMSTYTSNSDNTQRWQALIAGVRSRFSGTLTYSANWGGSGFPDEKDHIGFWPQLDYIGISAYFELYGSGDVANLESNWTNYNQTQIKPLSDANGGKPVLFTEIGYRSLSGAHETPWNSGGGGNYDAQEQVNDYTALLDYWNGQSFMAGVDLWDWSSDPSAGGQGDTSYLTQNKPAQDTIKQWFGQGGGATTTNPGGGSVSGSFSASGTASPSPAVVNQGETLAATLTPTAASSNAIVDLEVYNSSNTQVFQKFFQNESFTANQAKNYSASWTPTTAGTYHFTVGVFNNDWTKNYYWNEVASIPVNQTSGGTATTTNPGGGSNTSFQASATISPSQPTANQAATINAQASSKGALSNAIVDYEVYNASNARVFQQAYSGQNFTATTPINYQIPWTPAASGTYTIKSGIFNSDWSTNYYWNDNTLSVTVGQGTTNGNGGTSTTTNSGGNPGTPTSYNTNIWWPSNGATVQGVQPFKANLDGLDVSQYKMYWQVDGDALNEMTNSTADYPHKEALVDVSGWNWKGAGPYILNFVSKDTTGNVISQKSVSISVQH